ncbi:MAG TPA: hypothetical protein VGK77_22290 [Candidatus Binatia bacterium]|jgi:hypothetical protein
MTVPAQELVDQQDRLEKFYAALCIELFVTTDRELKTDLEYSEALVTVFEELFRRTDFDELNILASHTGEHNVRLEDLHYAVIAIAFGNFLAQRGIVLNKLPTEH